MSTAQMKFNVLVKKENGGWLAHCLELDIVAEGDTFKKATSALMDLIIIQFDYALANDNMKYFYKPAPEDVWQEFFACQKRKTLQRKFNGKFTTGKLVPSHIVTDTGSNELVYA